MSIFYKRNCMDDYVYPHAENAGYGNKILLPVISILPSCCTDLNVYYGGREIYRAVVQQLSLSTKARQISPSRKSHLTMEVLLAQSK